MRTTDPQISFADLEFIKQGIRLEPTLKAIADFLDQHGAIVQRVRRDLVRGLKKPTTGRTGLTAPQVLRSLILMRVKNWDYRELRERIADGYTLRHFTAFDSQRVPQHDAFNRAVNRLTPETLQAINDAVIQAAVRLGLEDGAKLRVDTAVVETDIHFPTDNTLLWDAVRVLTRLVKRLGEHVPSALSGFADRTRRARRRMQEISRLTPAQRPRQQKRKYRDLLGVTAGVVATARAAVATARAAPPSDPLVAALVTGVCGEIEHFGGLADRVIAQTRRRVLEGEQVPVHEKIFSIFEPHTDLLKRGKVNRPVEFGHKVFLAESGRGLITDSRVLDGNPIDASQVSGALDRHRELFATPLALCAMDRGFFSPQALQTCEDAGVAVECIPQRGGHKSALRTAYEKSRPFRQGQRFRAGIEGRISVLFRGRGMKRCLLHGRERFELFVGAAVLANNLLILAGLVQRRAARR